MTGSAVSLKDLEDRLAINDLFVRYTTALDRGDVETLVDCFTPDASLDSPAVGQHSGHVAIRAFAERFARFHEGGAQLRHVISNLAVEIDGDRARASCYLLNVLTRNGKSELLAPGRYECDLVKSGGKWRFHKRVVILDHDINLDGV
jgi:uncharacterized protein (TIGR02246 family)